MKKTASIRSTVKPDNALPINKWYKYIHKEVNKLNNVKPKKN